MVKLKSHVKNVDSLCQTMVYVLTSFLTSLWYVTSKERHDDVYCNFRRREA